MAKNIQNKSTNFVPEITDETTGGLYCDPVILYKKDPDPFEPVKLIEQNSMNSDRAQLNKISKPDNHPNHYNTRKIEVIDAIWRWGLDFIEGNVVKLITGSKHEGDRLGDLKKARWYLDYLIAYLDDKKE